MPSDREFFEAAFNKPPPPPATPQQVAHVDVVMTTPPPDADSDADLQLLPPVGKSASEIHKEREAMRLAASSEIEEDEPDELSSQFSLRELMQVVFFASIGFGIMHWVPADMFAGALGVAAILGMGVLTIAKPQKAFFYLAWWTLLAVYVIVSVFAVINKKP